MLQIEDIPSQDFVTKLTSTQVLVQLGPARMTIPTASRRDGVRAIHAACRDSADLPPQVAVLFALLAQWNRPLNNDNLHLVILAVDMLYRVLDDPAMLTPRAGWETQDLLASGVQVPTLQMLASLQGWERAKAVATIVHHLWHTRGGELTPWTIQPTLEPTDDPRLATALMALFAIAAESIPHAMAQECVAYPLHPARSETAVGERYTLLDGLFDWLVVACGTSPLPASDLVGDLGAAIQSTTRLAEEVLDVEHDALPADLVDASTQMSTVLLRDVARPPRYLQEILAIPLDTTLLPTVAAWGIGTLHISPRRDGLYVRPVDTKQLPIKCFWWAAQPTSAERVPNAMRGGIWPVMHLVLSALWHDLCAAAEVIERDDDQPPRAPSKPRSAAKRSRRSITLPPVQYRWGSTDERAALRAAHTVASAYRLLPQGWDARQDDRSFQARRVAATDRAAAYGCPAPPPGMTFVRPHQRGTSDDETAPPQIREIRARGLHTVALVLASGGLVAQEDGVDD